MNKRYSLEFKLEVIQEYKVKYLVIVFWLKTMQLISIK